MSVADCFREFNKEYNPIAGLIAPQEPKFFIRNPDPVFFVIPKRSIDTWAYFLLQPSDAGAIDENKSYKQQYRQSKFGKLGRQLAGMKPEDFKNAPESLRKMLENMEIKKAKLFS